MDKQYRVNLGFNADTKKAQTQIDQLQDQLTALVNQPIGIGQKLSSEILEASHAAAELKVHLQNATNVKTGALDFGKLNQSIQKSGQSLTHYAEQLSSLGPRGQQAFMSLANAIASAEVPLRRSNALLQNFMTTLKNTAKWQISSAMLHGLQSGVQQAFNYAQDLNESLNNIRIVTGQNVDQMARFAKEANAAAKALSTTTTEYTNASLIYYQQGLSTQEVKERTDLTIKMANVARVSAEQASDQLTAVWNNFADGTKSLEYYVDVMTALGAKTASSTDEIAGGLEKFAGIANTIGLSYEYATAAIATLTANTRQSEEVVGTALKTIFARIQGLNLGETLEDGVTLNKYSEAMKTVGIDILDQNKNLKTMDTLLNELGEKWNGISKAQQTALAQTVAGTRQYTQLVSLMDNWNKGDEDSFVTNVATARGASGSLQEQADIYAESWEAARDRVTASAEEIYSALFEDEGFIKLTNSFADLLDMVGDFVQSIGGLNGVLTGLGFVMTKVFSQQMAQGFRDVAYNITMSTEAGRRAVQNEKMKVMDDFASIMTRSDAAGPVAEATKQAYEGELTLQRELLANADRITEEEQEKCKILIEQTREYGKQAAITAQTLEQAQNRSSDAMVEIYGLAAGSGQYGSLANVQEGMADLQQEIQMSSKLSSTIAGLGKEGVVTQKTIIELSEALNVMEKRTGFSSLKAHSLIESLEGTKVSSKAAKQILEELNGELTVMQNEAIDEFMKGTHLSEDSTKYQELRNYLKEYTKAQIETVVAEERHAKSTDNLTEAMDKAKQAIADAKGVVKDWANHFSTVMSSLMSAGMLISSISGLIDTLKSPDTSGWEKFGSILTSVSMAAMSLGGVMQGVLAIQELWAIASAKENSETLKSVVLAWAQAQASKKVAQHKTDEVATTVANEKALEAENEEKIKGLALDAAGGKGPTTGTRKDGTQWYRGTNNKFISKDEYIKLTAEKSTEAASGGGSMGWGSVLSQALPAVAPYLAAAGAVALVAASVAGLVAWYDRWNVAAEKANAAAEFLSEHANKAKDSFNTFSSTLNNYDSAVESMKDLAKGTIEYNEALMNANASAMELLDKYENLTGHYTISNGLIQIDQSALLAEQERQLKETQHAMAQAQLAKAGARQADTKAQIYDLALDMDTMTDVQGMRTKAMIMDTVAVIAGIGLSFIPGVGPILGAITAGMIAAGSEIGIAVAGTASKAEQESIQAISNYFTDLSIADREKFLALDDNALREALSNLEGVNKHVIDALIKNRDALDKLTKTIAQNEIKDQSDWIIAYAAEAMAHSKEYANSPYQDAINMLAHSQSLLTDSEIETDVRNLAKGTDQDLAEAYLREVLGEQNVDVGMFGKVQGDNYRFKAVSGGDMKLQEWKDGKWVNTEQSKGDNFSKETMIAQLIATRSTTSGVASTAENVDQIAQEAKQLAEAGLGAEKYTNTITNLLSQYHNALRKDIDISQFNYGVIEALQTSQISDSGLQSYVNEVKVAYESTLTQLEKDIIHSSWYKALSDKELLWTINVNAYDSLDNVKQAYEALQRYLDSNNLVATIQTADALVSALNKEGKTKDDWAAIKKLYEEELMTKYEGVISFEEFMAKSQQEQIKYVEGVLSGATTSLGTRSLLNIAAQTTNRNNLQSEYDDAVDAKNAYEARADAAEQAVAQYQDAVKSVSNYRNQSIFASTDSIAKQIIGDPNMYAYGVDSHMMYDVLSGFDFSFFTESIKTAMSNVLYATDEELSGTIDTFVGELEQAGVLKSDWDRYAVKESLTNMHYNYATPVETADTFFAALQYIFKNTPMQSSVIAAAIDNVQTTGEAVGTDPGEADSTALDEANDKVIAAQQNYQNALDAQEAYFASVGLNLKDINNLAEYLERTNDALNDNQYLANAVAGSMLRYSNGVKAVADNYDHWLEILNNGDTLQRAQLLTELQTMYGNLLNIDGTLLSYNILSDSEILALALEVAEGKEGAYNRLQLQIASASVGYTDQLDDVLQRIVANDIAPGTTVDYNSAEGVDLYTAYRAARQTARKQGLDETEVDTYALNALEGLGFTIAEQDLNGRILKFGKLAEDTGGVLSDLAEDQKDDQLAEIERYKTINDQLDSIKDKYEDLTKAADRYYGTQRVKLIEASIEALKTELGLLEDQEKKYSEAGGYFAVDKQNMEDALAKMGVGAFTYDANGVITNYRAIMEAARNKAAGTAQDSAERANYEALLEAIDQYDETRELMRDINNQIDDINYKIQDANYNKLTEALNNDLEITNDLLKQTDFQISLLADDWTKMAEIAALMVGKDGQSGQLGAYEEILNSYVAQGGITEDGVISKEGKSYLAQLQAAYENKEISQANYVEGLKASRDAIYEQLEALTSLDKEMLEYYGNTLAKANEEIGKYISKMDNLNDVLEHYSSILKLVGRKKDYESLGVILQGVENNRKNQLDASKATYEFYATEAKNRADAYIAAQKQGATAEELEFLQQQWDDAVEAQANAYNEMLENTEAWAEATKAKIENAMEAAAATLENSLTGGTTFDFLNSELDHAVSIREEYLTTTNKIYETTKLIRTAQQAIDAATNNATKQKLKNFITETQQLQDQTELSQYELEIQQAKYDLLLAEIALEDAQNAKSVVRLQRDAAGNFGYVYTADANQVSDAEQKLADAENNLYNIALRGAEDYTTKSIEARQQLWEELQELDKQYYEGEITDADEYNARRTQIEEQYTRKLMDFSKLYSVAVETDTRVITESWSTNYAHITTDTKKWVNDMNTYLGTTTSYWNEWSTVGQEAAQVTGKKAEDLGKKIKGVTDESEALKEAIMGDGDENRGLIGALDDLLNDKETGILAITQAYADQRTEVQGLITDYANYITAIGKVIEAEKNKDKVKPDNVTDQHDPGPGTGSGETDATPEANPVSPSTPSPDPVPAPSTTQSVWGEENWTIGARVVFPGNRLPNGAPINNAKKVAMGLNDSLFISAIETRNGQQWFTVQNRQGEEVGIFPQDYLKAMDHFDTGGYTGIWGPEGKLAMLHEKELILNQQDTANILATVESVRHILEILDLHTLSAQVGGLLSTPGYGSFGSGTLEQSVHIEATFPNVSDRNEIEEAFNNLVNKASQYANRK